MISARTAARALSGEAHGDRVLCPGPGHSVRDRSLSVRFLADAPEGFVVFSHAGDDPMRCRDHVRECLGFPAWHPQGKRTDPAPSVDRCVPRNTALRSEAADEARRVDLAIGIWRSSVVELSTTPVETYLQSRGLHLPAVVVRGGAIRFHPACPFGASHRLPAMVALMVDPLTNEPRAIHRTALRRDGSGKADMPDGGTAKRWLSAGRGAVIKLVGDAEVTTGLGLSEGIENGIAALCAGWSPVWASGSAGNLKALPVLPEVECLTIFADRGSVGEEAADATATRWASAGREAEIRMPCAKDFNDAIVEAAA